MHHCIVPAALSGATYRILANTFVTGWAYILKRVKRYVVHLYFKHLDSKQITLKSSDRTFPILKLLFQNLREKSFTFVSKPADRRTETK